LVLLSVVDRIGDLVALNFRDVTVTFADARPTRTRIDRA
jgi:hypothetical protein